MWPVVKFAGLVGALAALLVLSSCTNQNASAKNQPGSPPTPTARASTGIEPTLSAGAQLASVSPVPGTGMTIIHMVQEGENLFHIARKYGTSVQAIVQANGLTDPTAISVGQKLIIPNIKATTEPEPTSTPTVTPTPVPPTATPVTPVIVTATPKAPTPTIDPNATPTLTPSPSPTPIPPDNVNGVKVDQFVIMPPAVQDNVRKIFAAGQASGNDPHRFSRVGDSIIEHPHFMVKFDVGPYNLGNYAYLQDVLNYYSGSFGHDSLSVRRGLHSWSVMNPTWADKDQCQPEEGPVACELRLYKPSIMFIVLGSNDVGVPEYFRQSMDSLVQYLIQRGVIPIIGTKADRHEGPDNINNTILREIATKYNVPLWDFDAVAGTMPNRGIDPVDGTHLTFYYAHDYTQPLAFTRGHAVQDLTAVITLDKLWRILGLNQ